MDTVSRIKLEPGQLEFLAGMIEARGRIGWDERRAFLVCWVRSPLQFELLHKAFGGGFSRIRKGEYGGLWRVYGLKAILALYRVEPFLLSLKEEANRTIARAIRDGVAQRAG